MKERNESWAYAFLVKVFYGKNRSQEEIAKEELEAAERTITAVLDECLPDDERTLVEVLYVNGGTLAEAERIIGIDRPELCRLEAKAFRTLRSPENSKRLKETSVYVELEHTRKEKEILNEVRTELSYIRDRIDALQKKISEFGAQEA